MNTAELSYPPTQRHTFTPAQACCAHPLNPPLRDDYHTLMRAFAAFDPEKVRPVSTKGGPREDPPRLRSSTHVMGARGLKASFKVPRPNRWGGLNINIEEKPRPPASLPLLLHAHVLMPYRKALWTRSGCAR